MNNITKRYNRLFSKPQLIFFTAFAFAGINALNAEIIVDTFDSPPSMPGSYSAFGENNLGEAASMETSTIGFNSTKSRTLRQTSGGTTWGVGVRRSFNSGTVDVSDYKSFGLQFYSGSNDSSRTVAVQLITYDPVFLIQFNLVELINQV